MPGMRPYPRNAFLSDNTATRGEALVFNQSACSSTDQARIPVLASRPRAVALFFVVCSGNRPADEHPQSNLEIRRADW